MAGQASNYKHRNLPNFSEKSKFHQGYFTPQNPHKCLTRENIYRSDWERKFMEWCDRNPLVVRWASEPVSVKYLNPVTNLEYCKKNHLNTQDPRNWKLSNYWTDMWIELKKDDGTVKKIFIEIKPHSQAVPPEPVNESAPLKQIKRYRDAAKVYAVNQAKWAAAKKFFESQGCSFLVFTEIELRKLGLGV